MAEALFVGRERETDLYKKFLLRKTPWVLIITGLGGIGKTTLLHQLAAYTSANRASSKAWVVSLDFADEELRSDPLKLLDRLIKDTAASCDVKNELKDEILENFDQLEHIRAKRVQAGVDEAVDLALQEIRHQMRELAAEAFYTQLKTFQLDQLVVMLDTCEWLNEPEGLEVGQWVFSELLPGIRTRLLQQGRQCSVVIASRVQPKLDAINGRDQRQLSLSMLGKAEVDQYLEYKGMQDADLRQRVYEVTHGHALCISIIGDFWQNREEQTQPLSISDLPELQIEEFSEIALMRFTKERVLRQLKSPFKELTEYGVLLRGFDLPLLRKVFPELLPESEAFERFNQLIRYSYIEPRGNYRYGFHELLREAVSEETQKEEPEAWKRYHKRALDYLTATSPHSPDWYYHLLAYDQKQGLAEWQQAIQEARINMKRELVGALLQAALDKTLRLSPIVHAEIAYEQGRFNYYGVQWEAALKSYQEALASFKEAGDHPGQAKVLQAMGDVNRTLGRPDDARRNYQEALIYLKGMEDYAGQARSYQAMGDVLRLSNDLDTALECYKQALENFRRVNDQAEQAKVLEAMGDVQRYRNDLDAALSSYGQALRLYQEENALLKRAKVLKVIGDVQRSRKDNDAAQQSYEQALALFGELKEPAEEARVRRAIEEMQQPEPVPIPYSPQESDEQKGYSDPPTLAVPYESLPQSLLSQAAYAAEIVLNGPFGQVMLGSATLSIGRNPNNHLVLDDPLVSSYHAAIQPSKEGYVLTDLGSRNGTFVNKRRIVANVPYTLSLGDRILIGDTNFTFESSNTSNGDSATYDNTGQGSIYEAEPITPVEIPAYSSQPQYQTTITPSPSLPVYSPYEAATPYAYTPPLPGGYPYALSQPPLPAPKQRRGTFRGIVLVLIALALLLLIAGSGVILLRAARSIVQPTVVAGTQLTETAIAKNNSFATATAITENNNSATAIPVASNPYPPHTGTLVLADPLRDNSMGNNWLTGTNELGATCTFSGRAYQATQPRAGFFHACTSLVTDFSNFVFEVQETLISGDYEGVVFRVDPTNGNHYYIFQIDREGNYQLQRYIDLNSADAVLLSRGHSAYIRTGLNQTNVIAVVASQGHIDLYVNQQKIASTNDFAYYSHGRIGVLVGNTSNSAVAIFRDARVWKL